MNQVAAAVVAVVAVLPEAVVLASNLRPRRFHLHLRKQKPRVQK
jgi:hypothetical protein